MDPMAVFKSLWSQRYWVLPVLLATAAAAVFVLQFGPRTYQSTMSYAVVSPKAPTDTGTKPGRDVNADNPYLRSSNPTLISDVVITRVRSDEVARRVKARGAGADYSVSEGLTGSGFIIDITGEGSTPQVATSITSEIGSIFERELYSVQKIHGADDRYLYSAIAVTRPSTAVEQFSSRLRAVIMVVLAGGVLMFAATSLGAALSSRRTRQTERAEIVETRNISHWAQAPNQRRRSAASPR
jgi:capsular polysaccharide biosynthesis protein